jgi:hypothetical protein
MIVLPSVNINMAWVFVVLSKNIGVFVNQNI